MTTEKSPALHATLRNALQALKTCSRKRYTFPPDSAAYSTRRSAELNRECVERGDRSATTAGPLIHEIADCGNLTKAQARRYLLELETLGLAMREPPYARGTAHRWWPVGFSDQLQQERATAAT